MKGPNESSDNRSNPAGERGAYERGAGKITIRDIERGASADAAAGTSAAGREQISNLEKDYADGRLTIAPSSARIIDEGGEHIVEHGEGDERVFKHTKGAFGFKLDPHDGTYATLEHATPFEYEERVHAQNELFGDDTRIEGVSKVYDDHVGLVVSQKYLKGDHPSQSAMEAHLRLLGFVQSKPQMLLNKEFAERTWYHPPSGYVVSDAKRDNFIQDAKGNIHVIDLMVQHAPPGSPLEKAMESGLPRKVLGDKADELSVEPKRKTKTHATPDLFGGEK